MCLKPWPASLPPLDKNGDRPKGRPSYDTEGDLLLPCGKCIECIKLRAFEWGIRAKHEISCKPDNCFITLSYDEDHIPVDHEDLIEQFKLFMKRIRKKVPKIKYMASHEYGTLTQRPHHHVLIFGWSPTEMVKHSTSKKGYPLFISKEVSKEWKKGFHSIGDANEKTAYYIASYSLKKSKDEKYRSDTGEIVKDSFSCSKHTGIGKEYFEKNYKQMIDSQSLLPRYYQKLLLKIDPAYSMISESQKMDSIRIRTPQEILNKFIYDHAKQSLSDSNFRSNPLNDPLFAGQLNYYKQSAKGQPDEETILDLRLKSSTLLASGGS